MGRYNAKGMTEGILGILKDRKPHRVAFLVQELGPKYVPYGVAIESYESVMRALRKFQHTKHPRETTEEMKLRGGYRERVLDSLTALRLIRTRDETGLVVQLDPRVLTCAFCGQPFLHFLKKAPSRLPHCQDCKGTAGVHNWKGKEVWRKETKTNSRS
jgi:predicted Zn-ribbon and HTH transcriptional regulator